MRYLVVTMWHYWLCRYFSPQSKATGWGFFANCAIRGGRENLRHPADMALPERDSGAIWWVQVRHYKLRTYASGAVWWMIMFYWAFCETSQKPYRWNLRMIAAVTLTSDPLTLKLVHGVLVSNGPFLPSLVFVGLFVFSLGGGTRQTNGQDLHMMGPPSRKDSPIIM